MAIFYCFHDNSMGYHGDSKILLPWGVPIHRIFYSAVAMETDLTGHIHVCIKHSPTIGSSSAHSMVITYQNVCVHACVRMRVCVCVRIVCANCTFRILDCKQRAANKVQLNLQSCHKV